MRGDTSRDPLGLSLESHSREVGGQGQPQPTELRGLLKDT